MTLQIATTSLLLSSQELKRNALTKSNPIAHKNRPESIIEEAIKIGYLIYPSKDLIWHLFKQQADFSLRKSSHTKHREPNIVASELLNNYNASNDDNAELIRLAAIKYLNASRLHTLEIGEICFCEHIEILNLSGNYIKRIEALAQCVHLSRLDLSDNQISQLPDVKFWLSFSKLKVLYLHSNTITKIDNVRRVSACPVLEILTLHDTPLSLKKNNRHHVINTIYTLKALDHFVVSDEEIIEDAKYNNKFSGRSQAFRINMHLKPTPGNTYSDEVKATSLLMAAINKIQAHHSPVIIIQKFIRGSIDRKYAKMYRDAMH